MVLKKSPVVKLYPKVIVLMDMPLFPYRIYAYNVLAKRGYDLTVVSTSEEDVRYPVMMSFKHIRLARERRGAFVKLKGFSNIDLNAYDVIIFAFNLRYVDYYQLFKKKYSKRIIAWGHMRGHSEDNALAQKLRIRLSERLPAIIFYDYATCEEFKKAGFDENKLFVANNTQYVNPATVARELKKTYFLYVGRIQERKGLDLALEAFAILKKKNPASNVHFKIVGGGDACSLQSLAAKLDITDCVEFDGPIHDEDKLGTVFSHAIAYVSPGHVGLGVLHSFAFGVPVITCSGRRHSVEFSNINEKNGSVVPYDKQSLYIAMEQYCFNKDYRKQKAEAAYRYYNDYCTIDNMVNGIDGAIKHTLCGII